MIERHPDGRLKLSQEQNRRFLTKIRFPEGEDGCWEWTGAQNGKGYGVVGNLDFRSLVHRLSYELFVGPLSGKEMVCHHCDNRACVRPSHLFLGDAKSNLADMAAKGRSTHGEKNIMAVLDAEAAREIYRARLAGEPIKSLMERFGVCRKTVYNISKRVSWGRETAEVLV